MIFEKNGTRDKARDVCLRVLKESNKSRFDSYSVRNSVLIISHITFRDCRAHIFPDNLSGIMEIAVFVEISHLESPVYFYFIFMVNVKLNWRDVILSTPGLHGSGHIWTDDFFLPVQPVYTVPFKFFYRLQYRLHVKSKKTCTVPRFSCKRKVDSCKFCPFKNFSGPVLTGSQRGHFILFCIQLFRERLSEKVHATIQKGIVGGFEFTFLQRNLKEWHLRPWTYVCEC